MLNKLIYQQIPSTLGSCVITASLLLPLPSMASIDLNSIQGGTDDYLVDLPYIQKNNMSTFDRYNNQLVSEFKISGETFEQEVTRFYSHLLASQESLGIEFEKILHENLWDLYES